jgi:hypothetical protein
MAPRLVEGRHGLPEAVDCLTIVALRVAGFTEVAIREGGQDDIPAGGGECTGPAGRGDGLVIRAQPGEMEGQKARDLS